MILRDNLPIALIDAELADDVCGTPWHGLVTSDTPISTTAKLSLLDASQKVYQLPTGSQVGDFIALRKPGHTFTRSSEEIEADAAENHKWLSYGIMSGSSHQFYGKELGKSKFVYLTSDTSYIVSMPTYVEKLSTVYRVQLNFAKAFELGGDPFTMSINLDIPKSILSYSPSGNIEVLFVNASEDGSKVVLGLSTVYSANSSTAHTKKLPECFVYFDIVPSEETTLALSGITTVADTSCSGMTVSFGPDYNIGSGTVSKPDVYHRILDSFRVLTYIVDTDKTVKQVKAVFNGNYKRILKSSYSISSSEVDNGDGTTTVTSNASWTGEVSPAIGTPPITLINSSGSYQGAWLIQPGDGTFIYDTKADLYINGSIVDTFTLYKSKTTDFTQQYIYKIGTVSRSYISTIKNEVTVSGSDVYLNIDGDTTNNVNIYQNVPDIGETYENNELYTSIYNGIMSISYNYTTTPRKSGILNFNVYTNNIVGMSLAPISYHNAGYYSYDIATDGTFTNLYINTYSYYTQTKFKKLYTYINGVSKQLHAGTTDYFMNTQCSYNYVEDVGSYFNQKKVCYV